MATALAAEDHDVRIDCAVVMRTSGGLLEVSTITTEERFDSTTTHTILGVPLLQLAALVEPDIPG